MKWMVQMGKLMPRGREVTHSSHSVTDPGLETSLPIQSCHDIWVLCDDDNDSMVHSTEDMDHKHGCLPTDPEEHQRRCEQKILTSRLPFMFNYYAI